MKNGASKVQLIASFLLRISPKRLSERRRSLEQREHLFISIPSDQGVKQCDTTERGWRPDDSLWILSKIEIIHEVKST